MCDALHTDESAPIAAVSAGRSRAPLGRSLPSPGTARAIAYQDAIRRYAPLRQQGRATTPADRSLPRLQDAILHADHLDQRRAD